MKNQVEIDAVARIRERNPHVPQRTLARQMMHPRFYCYNGILCEVDVEDCFRAGDNYATIYNRIRRIDGSIK